MRAKHKSALAIFTLVLLIPIGASCEDSTSFRAEYRGGEFRMTQSELLRFLPDELKTRTELGKVIDIKDFDVTVTPARDSAGLWFDTLSTNPDYLFVAYHMGKSILVVLKWSGSEYIEHCRSKELQGYGWVVFDDLDEWNVVATNADELEIWDENPCSRVVGGPVNNLAL